MGGKSGEKDWREFMCGIAGIIGKRSRGIETVLNDGIVHRGLDGNGEYRTDNVYFSHRRLSIIDTGSQSDQPSISDCGSYVLVYNGEIYNYIELRKKYLGDVYFRTESDTEVLLHMLIKFGKECLNLLNGMFAFSFYDVRAGSVLLSRDRLGIKPLYIFDREDLIFCSEITPIIGVLRKVELDEYALNQYLKYQTNLQGETLVKGVNMLEAGSYLIYSLKEKKCVKDFYWKKPRFQHALEIKDFRRDFKDAFLTSIELRLRSDVDFGIFLSGGIDSTAIVGAASQISTEPIKTLSIVPDDSKFDEAQFSRYIAKKYNTDHYELQVNAEGLKRMFLEYSNQLDYPSVDGFNNYIVTKKAASIGLKMALSGLGGDELFAGYPLINRIKKLDNYAKNIPSPIRRLLSRGSEKIPPGNINRALFILSQENPNPETLIRVFRNVSKSDFDKSAISSEQEVSINSLLSSDFSNYTEPILLRDVDQVSMRNGIEMRVPFLDHNLVELTWRHWNFDVSQKYAKQSLVDILNPLVPEFVANRRKMGFTLPWSNWISGELRPIFRENLTQVYEAGVMQHSEYQSLINDINNDAKYWVDIMKWNQLSVWLHKNDML
jgi:asparagine synthase (glutamine-hydrolysing)